MKGNFFKWKESVLERGTRKWVGVVDWVVRGVEVAWEKSITIECGGAVCLLVHGDVGVVGLKLLLINAREWWWSSVSLNGTMCPSETTILTRDTRSTTARPPHQMF